MTIIQLEERVDISRNAKLARSHSKLKKTFEKMRNHEWPNEIIESVNRDIQELNDSPLVDKELNKLYRKTAAKIAKSLSKELITWLDDFESFG